MKYQETFLFISLLLMIIFGYFYLADSGFKKILVDFTGQLQDFSVSNGYGGAFIITFISNASLLVPIPYGTILIVLGGIGLNPWLLGLIGGFAAGLGEIIGYLIGRGAGSLVSSEQQSRFQRIKDLIARRPRIVPWLIFLFGATPLPDDLILIPLGLIKYPFWKTIVPDFLGKLFMATVFSLAGKYSIHAIVSRLGSEGSFWSGMIIVALTVLAIYLTLKIKWENLIKL